MLSCLSASVAAGADRHNLLEVMLVSKANIKLTFENCSIPSVLETVVLLPNRFAESVTSYNYSSSADETAETGYAVYNSPNRERFIASLQEEQNRVYQLLVDDKVDPASHDIDYAFSTEFED